MSLNIAVLTSWGISKHRYILAQVESTRPQNKKWQPRWEPTVWTQRAIRLHTYCVDFLVSFLKYLLLQYLNLLISSKGLGN